MEKPDVYVLITKNSQGMSGLNAVSVSVCHSREKSEETLFNYVAENWDDELMGRIPLDRQEAISLFFDIKAIDEDWNIYPTRII